jgi:hypothetical protein
MSEVIIIIAVLIALAIGIILILAGTKPNSFSVRRAATVNAPAEKIFAVLSDFHNGAPGPPGRTRIPA